MAEYVVVVMTAAERDRLRAMLPDLTGPGRRLDDKLAAAPTTDEGLKPLLDALNFYRDGLSVAGIADRGDRADEALGAYYNAFPGERYPYTGEEAA